MAVHQLRQFLVCYDIADPGRLSKIHRALKKQGLPVQYSVFSVVMTKPALLRFLTGLERLMDSREDDLRCYPLPARIECRTLGRQTFPDGIQLFSKGVRHLMM